jgi:hypothetical protein
MFSSRKKIKNKNTQHKKKKKDVGVAQVVGHLPTNL